MTITRINGFHTKPGKGDELRDLLQTFVQRMEGLPDCEQYQVLQAVEDPDHIVVLERWRSVEAHRAAAQQTPVHAYERTMQLLASPPEGAYFQA